MRYDAVVVGGGPAGASVARELSLKGVRVLLLEKERLPRFKLCGGCLSARTSKLLPPGWEREVLNEIRGGVLGFRGKEFIEKTARRAVAYIIDRGSFDYFLVGHGVKSGAEVWEGVEVVGFEGEGPFRVETTKGTLWADFLVGADGFYTKVGKTLGYRKRAYFRSVEFWTKGELGDRVLIDIGVVGRGYAWVFPKGDILSVGVATTGKENLGSVLRAYASEHRYLRLEVPGGMRGWMIPFSRGEKDLHLGRGRVLLVGDAASLVDPLLGEGIYYALLSGKLAADSILTGGDDPARVYRRRVCERILPELAYAHKIGRLAYTFQRVAFRMGNYSLERFFELLRGEKTYKDLYVKGVWEFLKTASLGTLRRGLFL